MPRVTYLQTNFTAGELSPRLYGRVDVARYANGAKSLRNALVWRHGGVRRRYGTRFVAPTKDGGPEVGPLQARLIPFVFSRDDAYVLELGEGYLRVFKNGGQVDSTPGVPYEIATPYTLDQVLALDYAQNADTMFLYHVDVPVQRLVRLADNRWTIGAAEWVQQPTDEIGHRFESIALTLSAATVGTGRTATAGSACFLVTDIGRRISSDGGLATITAFTSATVVTIDITSAFTGTSIAAGDWLLEGSPQGFIKPFEKDGEPTEGKRITIAGGQITGTDPVKSNSSASWSAGTATMNCSSHGFTTGEWIIVDSVAPDGYNGVFQVTVLDPNTYTYSLSDDPGGGGTGGTSARLQGGFVADTWRQQDVGSIVRLNGGYARILAVHNPVSARVLVLASMTGQSLAAPLGWTLEQPVWSDRYGYPRTGTFYEQRHVVAGSRLFPSTVWGSRTGEPLNFEIGVADDRGFAFGIAAAEINPIAYVGAGRTLVAFTYGAEFTLNGGIERPIAPTNVQIRARSTHGCELVRPLRIGNEHLFVQRAGRKIRAFAYNVTNDDFTAPDVTVLAEHITESGIVAMAYQEEPDGILWAVRADGKLAACTYDRDPNVEVTAWAPQDTDGAIESIAVIPAGDADETWLIVRRTIDGGTVRYVERMVLDELLDCALVGSVADPGATIWNGLGHLEGAAVDVVADGAYAGRFTVELGAITLPRPALSVIIGLPYETRIELLDPELQTGMGSAVGNSMRTGEITLRLLESIGGTVNGQPIPTRALGPDALNTPPITRSGLYRIENLGWARGESPLVIEQPLPLRFQLLAVARKFTVND